MSARDLYTNGITWLHDQLRSAYGQSTTTATIEAKSGGVWTTVTADVAVLVKPKLVRTVLQGDRIQTVPRTMLYFLADPGVTKLNRITIGSKHYGPVSSVARDLDSGQWMVECNELME